jgi:hypothetical protein
MLVHLPAWRREIGREFKEMARLKHGVSAHRYIDVLALQSARRIRREQERLSNLSGTYTEAIYTNYADYTANANTSTETSLLVGVNRQPVLPALFFDQQGRANGKAITILARGVLSTTSTPTIIFQVRLGTTAGASFLSGTSVGVTAAITTAAGVTNKWWELRLDLICNAVGIGSNNTTLSGAGYVTSPAGFASPFTYALEPTTPDTATWTSTIDNSVTQYMNISTTWSAASASNTITLKQLIVAGLN